jgi:hypothetical protein
MDGNKRGIASIFQVLVIVVVALAAVPALVQIGWHARIFAARAGYPLDLEWMEGGMLLHAQRIAQGKGIYVAPSVDFIPFLYTPLYPALLALLSFVAPLGYVLGRVVSILAFAVALALLVLCCLPEASGRSKKLLAVLCGIGGAGAVAASFVFAGSFYDLVRSDSLLLALEATALWLALRGRSAKSAALAGLCIALGFFAKQTATIVGVGIGIGLLVAHWKRGLIFGASAAAVLAAGIGLLVKTSGGWFWTYIFKLHQSHAFRKEAVTDIALPFLHQFAWPLFLALALATVGLALSRRLRRSDVILWAATLAGAIAAVVGFGTQWADSNAFIPAIYFSAFSAAVLVARLVVVAVEGRKWGAVIVAVLAVLLLGSQSLHTAAPMPVRGRDRWPIVTGWPRPGRMLPLLASTVPSAQDRVAAARLLDELRALPSPLFIPFHAYYAVLAGKQPFVHRMGVRDVESALGRPKGLDEAIALQRFSAVVLDWKSYPGEWPHLERRYHVLRDFTEGVNSVRMFAGAETSPNRLYVPTVDAPPLPPGGRRLFDFELGNYAGFSVEGTAFGAHPAPAPFGMYGLYAADSGRVEVRARGILRSQPFVIEAAHLRFVVSGPVDTGLRVTLRQGTTVIASASPDVTARVVEWNTGGLVGQTVELALEDDSAQGALCADEFVVY